LIFMLTCLFRLLLFLDFLLEFRQPVIQLLEQSLVLPVLLLLGRVADFSPAVSITGKYNGGGMSLIRMKIRPPAS
jgi:hypothetical protein